MRGLLISVMAAAVLLSLTAAASAHKPFWCGHGAKKWTKSGTLYAERFNYHTNRHGQFRPNGNYHHVTVYVWASALDEWKVVHRHKARRCHWPEV